MEEPKRKSFFDVVRQNISLADRPEPLTRFLYIGNYKGSKDDLQNLMKTNAKELNSEYGETVFTGLLLVYPKSFLHLIETSQETFYRHLHLVLNKSSSSSSVTLQNSILLPAHHFVYKMYFTEWQAAYVANPPVLLDRIENVELEEICKQIKNLLWKTYSLCEFLANHEKISILKNLSNAVPHMLPEVTVIDYLLAVKSPAIQNLRVHLQKFLQVPFISLYNDSIWPPVWSFVPLSFYSSNKKRQ